MSELAIMDRDYAPSRPYSLEHPREAPGYRARPERIQAAPGRAAPGRAASGRAAPDGSRKGAARAAVAGVLLAAAAAALFFVVALPATEVRGLTVSGASSIDGAELLAWASLPEKAYWFSVDAASVEARLSAHPRIESVSVARRFPNRLVVSVVERAPVAVVFARNREGRMEAHCVDGHGVVFAPARAFPEASGLPVLSGLEIRGMRYGIRLEGPFSPLLASLADIRRSEPLLSSAISELRVVSREGAPAELLLYPANYRVPVRMRLALDAGLLKSMMLVLDVVEGEGLSPSIRELDLRTDTFVYRTKEAVSG